MRNVSARMVGDRHLGDVVGLEHRAGGAHHAAAGSGGWVVARSSMLVLTPCGHRQLTRTPGVAVGDAHPLGERDGGVLGQRVRRRADLAEQPGGGGGGAEVALTARDPAGQQVLRRPAVGMHVDVEGELPLGLGVVEVGPMPTPALAKNRSIGPNASSAASTSVRLPASVPTSAATATRCPAEPRSAGRPPRRQRRPARSERRPRAPFGVKPLGERPADPAGRSRDDDVLVPRVPSRIVDGRRHTTEDRGSRYHARSRSAATVRVVRSREVRGHSKSRRRQHR